MSDLPSLPVAQFVSSVDYWLNATWPMTEAEVCDLAAGAGWTLEDDGYVYVRNSALPFQEVLGVSKRDKEATAFSFSLTADVPDHDADDHQQVRHRRQLLRGSRPLATQPPVAGDDVISRPTTGKMSRRTQPP